MDFYVDKEKRRVILQDESMSLSLKSRVINEFDLISKKFLPNTLDTYECELVLIDVEKEDSTIETKAFARRLGNEHWLIEFNTVDFEL